MIQSRMTLRRSGWLAASAIAVASLWASPALAQGQPAPLPADVIEREASAIDRALGAAGIADLQDIIARAQVLAEMAERCKTMECPQFQTCEDARQLERDVGIMIGLLETQQRYLELANRDILAHFSNLVANESTTGAQQAALIEAIAVQDALIRFSDSLAQIATVIGSVQSLASGDSSRADKLLSAFKLGLIAEQLRGLEVSDSAAVTGSLGGALTKVEAAEAALRQAATSAQSAIAAQGINVTARAPTAAQALRGSVIGFSGSGPAPRATSSLADAGEIVQQLLSTYAKGQLAERQQRLADLIQQSGSEAAVRGQAFIALQKVQDRRFATIDALAALRGVQADLIGCMLRANCGPGSREPVSAGLPDFTYQLPDGSRRESWGRALTVLLERVEQMRPLLKPVGLIDDCPQDDDAALTFPETGLTFAFDSTTFCTFTEANPLFIPFFLPLEEPVPPPSGEGPPVGEVPPPSEPPGEDPGPAGEPGERIFRERPFPSAPLPEDLPPCEQLDLLGQAIEKEYKDAANENYSPQDRLAALNRAEELEARVRQIAEECLPKPPPEQGEEEQPPSGGPFREMPFPSAPIPEDLPPCEEFNLLRDGLEKEVRDAMNPAFSPEDRRAAKARADALEMRLDEVFPECQRTRERPFPTGEEPPDPGEPVPEPEPRPQPVTPPVIVNVKATSDAIARGSDASELGGQVVRLFAPSQLAQALPTPGGARPQDDHAADPVQAVTDRNGDAQLSVPSDIRLPGSGRIGLAYDEAGQEACTPTTKVSQRLRFNFDASRECDSGVTLGGRIRVEYDATPQDSVNVLAERPEHLAGVLSREALFGRFSDFGTIGGFTFGTLMFDKDQGERITAQLRLEFPFLLIEPNLCRIKEPAAVTEYHACKLGDRVPPAGARVLTPPDPHEELPGTALDLAQFHEEHE
ncbi:hypothetical protein [Qipengyuania sp. ASV99]|uniref:hypothetical protein n=1 Tax=Qipengyuania sp. ASV99 TaxID=3399681 RepID=UPI003A4C6DCF